MPENSLILNPDSLRLSDDSRFVIEAFCNLSTVNRVSPADIDSFAGQEIANAASGRFYTVWWITTLKDVRRRITSPLLEGEKGIKAAQNFLSELFDKFGTGNDQTGLVRIFLLEGDLTGRGKGSSISTFMQRAELYKTALNLPGLKVKEFSLEERRGRFQIGRDGLETNLQSTYEGEGLIHPHNLALMARQAFLLKKGVQADTSPEILHQQLRALPRAFPNPVEFTEASTKWDEIEAGREQDRERQRLHTNELAKARGKNRRAERRKSAIPIDSLRPSGADLYFIQFTGTVPARSAGDVSMQNLQGRVDRQNERVAIEEAEGIPVELLKWRMQVNQADLGKLDGQKEQPVQVTFVSPLLEGREGMMEMRGMFDQLQEGGFSTAGNASLHVTSGFHFPHPSLQRISVRLLCDNFRHSGNEHLHDKKTYFRNEPFKAARLTIDEPPTTAHAQVVRRAHDPGGNMHVIRRTHGWKNQLLHGPMTLITYPGLEGSLDGDSFELAIRRLVLYSGIAVSESGRNKVLHRLRHLEEVFNSPERGSLNAGGGIESSGTERHFERPRFHAGTGRLRTISTRPFGQLDSPAGNSVERE